MSGRRLLLGLALAAGVAWNARADFRQSYLDGVRAFERREWTQAARHFERALAERGEEQPRARLVGAIPEPYLPHAYLGFAFQELGRCREALEQWRLSEAQGAVQKVAGVHAQLIRRRGACEADVDPKAAPLVLPPPVAISVMPTDLARELERAPVTEPLASPGPAGEPPRAEVVPEAALPASETASVVPPLPREELPLALVAGVQAYFDGEYLAAVDRLSRYADDPSSRVRAIARLLRSAARHALYLLGGEGDVSLLDLAVADLRLARAELPAFAPHPDLFSPRFVAFFRDHP